MRLLPFAALAVALTLRAAEPDTNRFTPEMAEFVKRFKGGGMLNDGSARPTPAESLKQFNVAPGLRWELAATEPMVRPSTRMGAAEVNEVLRSSALLPSLP